MRYRLRRLVIILAFSFSAGHWGWTTFGPAPPWEHSIGGEVLVLRALEPRARNLYVRRSFFLPEQPRAAWIQILGRDRVEFYVNGQFVTEHTSEEIPVARVVDLTRYIREGKNVVAAVCRQLLVDHAPEFVIEGGYELSDGVHRFDSSGSWRYIERYDRRHDYWFAVDYDDGHWQQPVVEWKTMRATLPICARAITGPTMGTWIRPDRLTEKDVILRGRLELPERIRYAWLRLQSNSSYRLAVNGVVVSESERRLGTTLIPDGGTQRIYDVSELVGRGSNCVAVKLTTKQPPPRLLIDFEATGRSGTARHIVSDSNWQWHRATKGDWTKDSTQASGWRSCETADVRKDSQPWDQRRVAGRTTPPLEHRVWWWCEELAAVILLAIVSWVVIALTDRLLASCPMPACPREKLPADLIFVLPTVLFITCLVDRFDPRVSDQTVFQPLWLIVALALIAAQWFALIVFHRERPVDAVGGIIGLRGPSRWIMWTCVLLVVIASSYFRLHQITVRALTSDEVVIYMATMNIWKYGFPALEISEHTPVVYASTSELVNYFSALASLIFENDRLVVRAAPACFGIATTLLIFLVGARMFRPWVGVIAAAIHAFSPFCMLSFNAGRYFSQLQFFTLLTAYFFYRTIQPSDRIDRRAVWWTACSFIMMFLSWEGSALLAASLIVAALILRRDRIHSMVCDVNVWLAITVVAAIVLVQQSHRALVQTARPLIGKGASDVLLTLMGDYPNFQPWSYVWSCAPSPEMLLSLIGLAGACLLAVRHPFARPCRFLLIIFLGTGLLQTLLLPVIASRYGYHLMPFGFLCNAAALFVLARAASTGQFSSRVPFTRWYTQAVAALVVVPCVWLGSGISFHSCQLAQRNEVVRGPTHLGLADQEGTGTYVRQRLKPGDVVIANAPHVTDHYVRHHTDYWLQSQLRMQAFLDDERTVAQHRYVLSLMVKDVDHLRDLFRRHKRVWLITEPEFNLNTNVDDVIEFVRRNMDVVYEDRGSMVLLRDANHRSARMQRQNERTLQRGLPHLP